MRLRESFSLSEPGRSLYCLKRHFLFNLCVFLLNAAWTLTTPSVSFVLAGATQAANTALNEYAICTNTNNFFADELDARAGDIINGLELQGQWWKATSPTGAAGMIPANYTERAVGGAASVVPRSRPAVPPTAPGRSDTPSATSIAVRPPVATKTSFATDDGFAGMFARKPGRKPQYGYLALNMAHMSLWWCLLFGFSAWVWADHGDPLASTQASHGIAYYCMALGVAIYLFEYCFALRYPLTNGLCGCDPKVGGALAQIPIRGPLNLIVAIPLFTSYATALAGFAVFVTGLVSTLAVWRGEQCKGQSSLRRKGGFKPPVSDNAKAMAERSFYERGRLWCVSQIEAGELGKWFVLLGWVGANIGLGVFLTLVWTAAVAAMPEEFTKCRLETPLLVAECIPPLSRYAAYAKVCGGLLNFNCALLLLPVLRGLIKFLNTVRFGNSEQGALATYVPLRKNIIFHKAIARWVFVLAALHTLAHFVNYGLAADPTLRTFPSRTSPPWFGAVDTAPWVTGALICVAIFFIYTGAGDAVKHAEFEIFWFSHHFLFLFYVAQMFHGPVFVYWTIVPFAAYVLERVWRVQRGSRKIYLRTVKWIDPVLCLEWVPHERDWLQFSEGMYVYLNCPALSANEWHPFTISSARGDLDMMDFVSLHIRIHKGGWTERLKEYLTTMNPTEEYPFVLYRRNNRGERVVGKLTGPDGQQLIRVDGPHTAPTVHYSSYHATMVIGAGIGLTPVAAVARATLRYKWKRGHFPDCLFLVWVIRQSEIAAFQWFVQLLAELEAERARDLAARNVNKNNHVEFHVFVTRVDNNAVVPPLQEQAGLPADMLRIAPFTPEQLMRTMYHPPASSKNMERVMADPESAPNHMQDLWVWNGRPNWDTMFQHVKNKRDKRFRDIGVCYCGAPIIGKDLKAKCETYSQQKSVHRHSSLADMDAGGGGAEGDVRFILHKENF